MNLKRVASKRLKRSKKHILRGQRAISTLSEDQREELYPIYEQPTYGKSLKSFHLAQDVVRKIQWTIVVRYKQLIVGEHSDKDLDSMDMLWNMMTNDSIELVTKWAIIYNSIKSWNDKRLLKAKEYFISRYPSNIILSLPKRLANPDFCPEVYKNASYYCEMTLKDNNKGIGLIYLDMNLEVIPLSFNSPEAIKRKIHIMELDEECSRIRLRMSCTYIFR